MNGPRSRTLPSLWASGTAWAKRDLDKAQLRPSRPRLSQPDMSRLLFLPSVPSFRSTDGTKTWERGHFMHSCPTLDLAVEPKLSVSS